MDSPGLISDDKSTDHSASMCKLEGSQADNRFRAITQYWEALKVIYQSFKSGCVIYPSF